MTLRRLLTGFGFAAAAVLSPAFAGVIGTNIPAEAITAKRIATLPADQREAWSAYLQRSEAQRKADKAALAAERKGMKDIPPPPHERNNDTSMPLHKDPAWYATPEARHIADNIVSFQTPAGGWGKNQDRSGPVRVKGQSYVPENISKFLAKGDFDAPREPKWNYVGTFDNNATSTEMFFLARVIKVLPDSEDGAYRAAFLKGLRYLLAAQFPNGGWPQVWPLEGGYHDAITYNDDAVTLAATVMSDVAANMDDEFAFVPGELRAAAGASAKRALAIVLATQVRDHTGALTLWGQQHDALTLKPCSARNFEPPLLASDESASLLVYLMSLPDPSPALQTAIRSGATWLQDHAVTGLKLTPKSDPDGIRAVASPGAPPLWARYYDPETGKPLFADRDKTLHDDMNEISKERRNGYHWYDAGPEKALKAFAAWSAAHPAISGGQN